MPELRPIMPELRNINDAIIVCHNCSQGILSGQKQKLNGRFYCPDCVADMPVCEKCNEHIAAHVFENDDGDVFCGSCYAENYISCAGCDCEVHNDNSRYNEYDGCGYCESCFPSSLDEYLNAYDYKPEYKYYRGINEFRNTIKNPHNLYFGIELEIELMENDISNVIDGLPDFVYAKEDNSLDDGFEIVSHPTTYQWLCENSRQWLNILDIRMDGYRSYNTTTCGMHIHLSKNYFGTLHLYKFLKFFYENPDFILMISQRDKCTFNRWASLKPIKDYCQKNPESIYYKAKYKSGNYERHCAINLQNKYTIEIRIFRGTLNPRSFWKNIEFLQALVEFTAKTNIQDICVRLFNVYVFKNRQRFVNLHNWLHSKDYKEKATVE